MSNRKAVQDFAAFKKRQANRGERRQGKEIVAQGYECVADDHTGGCRRRRSGLSPKESKRYAQERAQLGLTQPS